MKKQIAKKRTIGINMNIEITEELDRRAHSMHISLSKYCAIVLKQWLDSREKLSLQEKA